VGQPRVPEAVKRARGTFKPSRTFPNAPHPEVVSFAEPPPGMTKAERETWVRLAAQVDPLRVTTAADREAFGLTVATLVQARRALRSRKVSQAGKNSTVRTAFFALSHFGLSPASRTKVQAVAAAPDKADPLAEFLS